MYRMERSTQGLWSKPEFFGSEGEVVWQYGEHDGKFFASSYNGKTYSIDLGEINLHFNVSKDGKVWEAVNPEIPATYNGGISEVGWAFDLNGSKVIRLKILNIALRSYMRTFFHLIRNALGSWTKRAWRL